MAALRLPAETLALLSQLGIDRLEQLARLERTQVADRCGAEVCLRLDQAWGRAAEVIAPFHEQPEAAASWVFEDPIERRHVVAKVLDELLDRLEAILAKRCCGTRLLECVFEQEGAAADGLSAGYHAPRGRRLTCAHCCTPAWSKCASRGRSGPCACAALVLERIPDGQGSLFDGDSASNEAALAQLLDSLVSRLGPDAVTKAHWVADPQPELACRFECALQSDSGSLLPRPALSPPAAICSSSATAISPAGARSSRGAGPPGNASTLSPCGPGLYGGQLPGTGTNRDRLVACRRHTA